MASVTESYSRSWHNALVADAEGISLATSADNIHKLFLRHISCPVVGYVNRQVRLINRMKNVRKKINVGKKKKRARNRGYNIGEFHEGV